MTSSAAAPRHGALIGDMTPPVALTRHRLKGRCPDGRACTLPVHCSQLCSRLESAEIAAEMLSSASRTRLGSGSVAGAIDPLDVRDVVHQRAAEGEPIVVPDPGTDHGRALVKTFGAHIKEEEPSMDEPAEETVPPPDPVADYPCKAPGCPNRTSLNRGRYAYTCPEHRNVDKPAGATRTKRTKTVRPIASTNGHVARTRIELLGLLVKKQTQLEELQAQIAEHEAEFGELADEFSKATA